MNSAKKKLPSLEEELLKNDCDCLCRAVARLLQSSGSGLLSTDVVRQDLASEVENHQSRYIGFFHDEKALHAWIESMKKEGEWCDGRIAVRAAAHLFGVPFVVFRKCSPDQPPSCFLPEYIGPGNDKDLDPLCLVLDEPGAEQENYKPTGLEHYNPLVCKCEKTLLAIEDGPIMPSLRRLDAFEHLSKSAPADDLAAAGGKQQNIKRSQAPKVKKLTERARPKKDKSAKALLRGKRDKDVGDVAGEVDEKGSVGDLPRNVEEFKRKHPKAAPKENKDRKRKAKQDGKGEKKKGPGRPKKEEGILAKQDSAGDGEAEAAPEKKKKRKARTIEKDAKPESDVTAQPQKTQKTTLTLDGDFVQGALLTSDEMGMCRKCESMVSRESALISGKKSPYWVCKVCHARTQQLKYALGKWPPENFKQLDNEEKTAFFKDIKEISGSKRLKMFAEEWLKTVVVDVQGKRYTNEYLPMSVWKVRGFSEEQIMACNDTMDHPLFGQLYALSLLTKYVEHEERQERGEKTTVTDDCVQGNGGAMAAGKEDRKMALEVIHINGLIN